MSEQEKHRAQLTEVVEALTEMTEELRVASDEATAEAMVALEHASNLSEDFTSEGLEALKQATTMLGYAEGLAKALNIVQARNAALLNRPLAKYVMD